MKIEVRLEPEGNEDNQYATPCYFEFENCADAVGLFSIVCKNGKGVEMHISKKEE